MGRTWLPALLLPLGLGLFALSIAPRHAKATQLLANPGLETWGSGGPASWYIEGGSASAETTKVVAGTALRVTGADRVTVQQTVLAIEPGARYQASVHVAGDPGTEARLVLQFSDEGYSGLGLPYATSWSALGGDYRVLELPSVVAPPGAAGVTFRIEFALAGGASVEGLADEASLTMVAPPEPTSTPEPTATPITPTNTPTETAISPTQPPTASAVATSGGGSGAASTATATVKVSPTKTATTVPTVKKPTGGKSTKIGTPTKVPTLPPTSTPTRPPGKHPAGSAWALLNGGFESATEGKPHYWNKYGGTLGLEGGAFEGSSAATLSSETQSTKWIYQTVRVEAGRWYRATAVGRMSIGTGAVFLRLSWYVSEDGSGTMITQAETERSASRTWARLSVTAQAPEGANSVRVRLMLQPGGHCTAAFDAVEFAETSAPEPDPTATSTVPTAGTTAVAGTSPSSPSGGQTADVAGVTAPGAVAVFTGPASVRLSEVLSDPEEAGRDSAFEWVELVNTGAEPVDLAGWQIGDAKKMDTLPSFVLAAGGYVVVAGKSASLPEGVAAVRVPDGEIGGGLNNTGDTVRLIAPGGTVVDAISFGDDNSIFDPPPPVPEPGMTIGIRDPRADQAATNWALTDRPSPGTANTFPGRAAASKTPETSAGSATMAPVPGPAPVLEPGGKGSSALPWVLLGGVAGAGLLGLGSLAKGAAPAIRRRITRGD